MSESVNIVLEHEFFLQVLPEIRILNKQIKRYNKQASIMQWAQSRNASKNKGPDNRKHRDNNSQTAKEPYLQIKDKVLQLIFGS